MRNIGTFLLVFCVVFGASAKEAFVGSTYYYWSDAEGKWTFEFSESGDFSLYDIPRESSPVVDLPGYGGEVQAGQIKGKYEIQKSGAFTTVKVGSMRFLVTWLDDKYCFLYEIGKEHRAYRGINQKYLDDRKRLQYGTPEFNKFISVSSALPGATKDGIVYHPPFYMTSYEAVWAFSGQSAESTWVEFSTFGPIGGILVVNGLVLPSQPEYFLYNRRPKVIRISSGSTTKRVALEDTINPQEVPFPTIGDSQVRIEVIDYYAGTRFDDAALSFLGTYR